VPGRPVADLGLGLHGSGSDPACQQGGDELVYGQDHDYADQADKTDLG
jgi:hypothetical protein